MFSLGGLSGGLIGLIGLAVVSFFFLGFLLFVVIVGYVLVRNANRTKEIAESATTIVRGVDFSDGVDDREWALIREMFAAKKKEEEVAAVKEKLVKAAGFEVQ